MNNCWTCKYLHIDYSPWTEPDDTDCMVDMSEEEYERYYCEGKDICPYHTPIFPVEYKCTESLLDELYGDELKGEIDNEKL